TSTQAEAGTRVGLADDRDAITAAEASPPSTPRHATGVSTLPSSLANTARATGARLAATDPSNGGTAICGSTAAAVGTGGGWLRVWTTPATITAPINPSRPSLIRISRLRAGVPVPSLVAVR